MRRASVVPGSEKNVFDMWCFVKRDAFQLARSFARLAVLVVDAEPSRNCAFSAANGRWWLPRIRQGAETCSRPPSAPSIRRTVLSPSQRRSWG
ncbi:hypothetical protein MRX96_027710 [Rhipicephalus microplus]